MYSQEEHNKLTDKEKFKLIEFYKENSELWVTLGKKPKRAEKEELVEEFDRKFSIEILEKVFPALRASFLREHKSIKNKENCRIKVGNPTKACFLEKRANDQ